MSDSATKLPKSGGKPGERPVCPRVSASRVSALLNLIYRLYQIQDEIPGGTAGAVRNEVMTGEFINGGHAIKAQEMITALTKLINSGELNPSDEMIAEHLIWDLKNSLGK